jgi:hypothetical protein
LQRLTGCLLSQQLRCEPAQLGVHQRQQLLCCRRIAGFDLRQDVGNVGQQRGSQKENKRIARDYRIPVNAPL